MLVILADDLTGALDSAAPFAGRGLHTEVALSVEAVGDALAQSPAVLAVNVASREIAPEAARELTADVLRHLPQHARIFKKVDSRLKGNIAAELDAMSFKRALVAPAIPDFGRIVADGHISGFGVDLPIRVADTLGAHGAQAFIPDTASQPDMAAALTEGERQGCDLLVGARGLADALARQMTCIADLPLTPLESGPLLIVIGSRDPITLRQVEELRQDGLVDYHAAPAGRLPHPLQPLSAAVTLVQATEGEMAASPVEVSASLAEGVVPALTGSAAALLLSGGATAEAVLAKIGIARFRLLGECRPGLGLASAGGWHIITKSGGFGSPETLRDIADEILRRAA
ncbi:MAG TPA: four-carbon acid sugar kinase family protein [Pseudorhizobium sp.]|nr:four-carbon acid sugar kinase family protein [Pseudorhizobium sp.]